MTLNGKVALITGGGTGIGAAIAERFVADGAKVCITGRRQELLDKVIQSLPADKALACSGDVSRLEDVERMVATALDFGGGRLDVLVNNAAINLRGSVTKLDLEAWRKVLDVNLTGPFLLMKVSIPHMIESGGGSVINISSLGGLRCMPAVPAYSTSKAGLIMLTQQAALDYGPYNVRCNAVCPGGVRTTMMEGPLDRGAELLNIEKESVLKLTTCDVPLRRLAEPFEVSGICSYLASDDASFMTGGVLVIDGGAWVVDAGRVAIDRELKNASVRRKGKQKV